MSVVVFLIGDTMGDALGSSGRALRTSFEQLGLELLEVNFAEPEPLAKLDSIIKGHQLEFVFSFVGMGMDMEATTSEGAKRNLWEALGVPLVTIHGDSPAYFFDRHVVPHGPFASVYAFREHCELRKRLPELRGLLGVVPPAAEDKVPRNDIDFARKVQGKLLFLKNGNNPEELVVAWRENLPETTFVILTDLASELAAHMESDRCNDIDGLVCTYFSSKGWDIEALPRLRLFFIAQLDDYCRRLKSTLIAESLLEFPVEVHGFNWEHVDFLKSRATLVPFADHKQSRTLIRDALGVIDMSPNTGQSPHDRPRRAFGSYTLCLTNEQQCFKDRYPNYTDFSFRFDRQAIQTKVADVLAHPKRYVELGVEVAERYRADEDPLAVARYLQDTANVVRLQSASSMRGLPRYFAWPPSKLGPA